jgi:hypothetical protein
MVKDGAVVVPQALFRIGKAPKKLAEDSPLGLTTLHAQVSDRNEFDYRGVYVPTNGRPILHRLLGKIRTPVKTNVIESRLTKLTPRLFKPNDNDDRVYLALRRMKIVE